MAGPIRIRIVAAVDSSLANVFVPIVTASKRASAQIGQAMADGAKAAETPYRSMPAKIKPGLDQVAAAAKKTQADLGAVADGARAKFDALRVGLGALPVSLSAISKEAQRALGQMERLRARQALGLTPNPMGYGVSAASMASFGRQSLASGMGGGGGWGAGYRGSGVSWAGAGRVGMRLGMGALSMGTRFGADMLHGLGINTDIGQMFSTNQMLETTATNVSNFGYIPGDRRNGNRVGADALIREAHGVAQQTGNQASDVLTGLEKFVGLTGDLATGRESMKDLAVLSKATGSHLAEMVEAAGNVSNVLGDIPDKGKAVYDVMRAVAGEGKTGAVLIKDLAVQMAKVAAGAQMFTGDRSTNIAVLGALAQEARGRGGAASAAQAATSVSSFVNTFSKGARLMNFKGFGVETQGAGGLRDARDIIVDTFNAAMHGGHRVTPEGKVHQLAGGEKNFSQNIGMMFADVRARSAVRGFESIYRETYSATHGDEKEKEAAASRAVRAEFERLTSAAMSQELVLEDFKIAMQTSKSKAEIFNDTLLAISGDLRTELMGPFMEMAPGFIAAAKAVAEGLAAIFGRPGAPEVQKDLERFNSLDPARRAADKGTAGDAYHWDPTAGGTEFKASQTMNWVTGEMEDSNVPNSLARKGSLGKSGMWVHDTAEITSGTQDFVEKKRDEAQQELDRARAKERKAEDEFRKLLTTNGVGGQYGGLKGSLARKQANELLNDPAKLREYSTQAPGLSNIFGFNGGIFGQSMADNVLATRTAVGRAQQGLDETQELADRLADGIEKKTIKVIVVNAQDMKPPRKGTSASVGDGGPGRVGPGGVNENTGAPE